MKIQYIFGLLSVIALVGAGCSKTNTASSPSQTSQTPEQVNTVSVDGANSGDLGHGGEHITKLAGSRVALENKNSLQPGEVTFSFKLYGLDGHEFGDKDLKVVHEKKMHFLLVRDDMTGFQHLHPEYKNEKWEVTANKVEAGNYQLYVDIAPLEENATVLRVPVTFGSATQNAQAPVPNTDLSAEDNGYKVALQSEGNLKTNEHSKLTFEITKNGKPVTTIDPYLGAYGHVVLLRHTDADDFFHVHPLTETKPTDGKVQFDAQFPTKGRYTLYAQFNIDGSVKTFPITLDVSEVGQDAETSHGHDGIIGGHN